jgi:broad specificity phosphatase PhoE
VIYLVRHGETAWNKLGRKQGWGDSPLTENGIEQARVMGRALRREIRDSGAVRVESSPLGRARETAAIICRELGVDANEIAVSPLLIEHGFGEWQGLTNEEVDERYPGERERRSVDKWSYVIPGGESYSMVYERAKLWLAAENREFITIAVAHEMISRTIQGVYGGLAPEEILKRDHPHTRIYRLSEGKVEEIVVEDI